MREDKPLPSFSDLLTPRWVGLLAVVWIVGFGIIYYFATPQDEAEPVKGQSMIVSNGKPMKGLGNALYFSVVTATTLGYGDAAPIGWLRVAAVIEVAGGLVLAGLAVASIQAVPLRRTRKALRECPGHWIERSLLNGTDIYYTHIQFIADADTLLFFECDFAPGFSHDRTRYTGRLIANDFPKMVFEYRSDSHAKDYERGIEVTLFKRGARRQYHEFEAHCYDAKHGLRDSIEAWKVTDPQSIAKLEDPSTRRDELSRLIKEWWPVDLTPPPPTSSPSSPR